MQHKKVVSTFRGALRQARRVFSATAAPVLAEVLKLATEVACVLGNLRMLLIHLALQPLPVQLGLISVVTGILTGLASHH